MIKIYNNNNKNNKNNTRINLKLNRKKIGINNNDILKLKIYLNIRNGSENVINFL